MSHSQWSRPTHTRLAALLDGRELAEELVQGARHRINAVHPGGLAEEQECEQHLPRAWVGCSVDVWQRTKTWHRNRGTVGE